MTTAVHLFLPVSAPNSNHLLLSAALDAPTHQVMQPYPRTPYSDSTIAVVKPLSAHITQGELYQLTSLRPISPFSSSQASLPPRTLPPPSSLDDRQHFSSQTYRQITPIGTSQTLLTGLGRYETKPRATSGPLIYLDPSTDIQEPLVISVNLG